jgi:hypothetical protein
VEAPALGTPSAELPYAWEKLQRVTASSTAFAGIELKVFIPALPTGNVGVVKKQQRAAYAAVVGEEEVEEKPF